MEAVVSPFNDPVFPDKGGTGFFYRACPALRNVPGTACPSACRSDGMAGMIAASAAGVCRDTVRGACGTVLRHPVPAAVGSRKR